MAWRVAGSLLELREQLNALAPDRSTAWDGFIGDAAHASRTSDHNPWIVISGVGVVTAGDFTNDPLGGLDCEELYQALVASRDPRIKYIIWNKTITSGADGPSPWVRRPYTGINDHTHHLHLSVETSPALFDSKRAWDLGGGSQREASPIVKAMQRGMHYASADMDGFWGPNTDNDVYAVRQANYARPPAFPYGVERVQRLAATPVTGVWTSADAAALRDVVAVFQRAWGVDDDGYWGLVTEAAWKKFHGLLYVG